ncbi:hypothetical protein TPHA_0G03670 [Tetrapisispora phaffii CBS 4417]|uniref:37S ribosomal protein YMR-31, mitochondrial n=1 Tax=Tetrapisispora phaffii (strain ATCC 24235 / CBS 4417 / NBRC 1672 / NRRL Y-8282 / UCD 70-5) TaxID=1071381 RepID=G8BWC9_TETPH|nr:mitochondrial 37S ribosomal protein YMR31 TPHA_0G03670 [Tetrapisispora phaffii CBS 4417]CCE64207.1 hypothetical protein TPHA_0G03670 [Tetrapisispora phaffii CBS 4417]
MRQTVTKLAQSYTPMIKFLGKHPVTKHPIEILPHPCTVNGLVPGGEGCLNPAEYLKNSKPFVVVPYKKQHASKTTADGAISFTDRPLQNNEVSSIAELPAKYRFKPIEEKELECINSGGVM